MKVLKYQFFSILLPVILLLAGCAPKSPVKLTILHWNDFHSQNVPFKRITKGDTLMVGGAANLAAYLNHYRKEMAPTLELNAGDDFQGTPISAMTKGKSQVELQNMLKPDAFTIGNHEFDYGIPRLQEVLSEATFPVLLGNAVNEKDQTPYFESTTILESGGIKVGVIGVVTEGLKEVTTAKATAGLAVTSAAKTVREGLELLSPKTDIQIVLSHMGYRSDSLLANEIGGELELIIGGHSHTRLYEPRIVNEVPIVQARAKGEFLGIVEMTVDPVKNDIIELSGKIERVIVGAFEPDPLVKQWVDEQEKELSEAMDKVVATLTGDMDRNYRGESPLGNWVSEAYRIAANADIGFMNGGGLRKNLKKGPVTVRDIFEVSPFGNELMRFKLTGEQLKTFVLYQAAKKGSRMQISGLRYHVKNGKIKSLTVNGQEVQGSDTFTAVTVNYVTDHQDRFFKMEPGTLKLESLYLVDRDVLLAQAESEKTIEPSTDGRIRIE